MTRVLCIDPGQAQSALLGYDTEKREILYVEISSNATVQEFLSEAGVALNHFTGNRLWNHLIIESIACYGMPVGEEVFATAMAIGDFRTIWGGDYTLMPRTTVKAYLCNSSRAKDSNVRQVLIDKFGPGKQKAIGLKASPGPLFGLKSHLWSALALAVTFAETEEGKNK